MTNATSQTNSKHVRYHTNQSPSGRWLVTDTDTGRVVAVEIAQTRAIFKCAALNRKENERSTK